MSINRCSLHYLENMNVYNLVIFFLFACVPWGNGFLSSEQKQQVLAGMTMRFYYGLNPSDYYVRPLNESVELMTSTEFNNSRCSAVHLFGYSATPDNSQVRAIIEAYVITEKYNTILVDWRPVTDQDLIVALELVEQAGKLIAQSLNDMEDNGMNMCHLSGHNLGGQCVGFIARNMKHKVTHLIGLDPMGPVFYLPLTPLQHISETDADCVEIIHSNGYVIGAGDKTGKLDYYPNGGTIQPGCLDIDIDISNLTSIVWNLACSHLRAPFIWADVILEPKSFPARKCDDWLLFTLGLCNSQSISYIGDCKKDSVAGKYYLRTSSSRPLGLGNQGL